MINIKNAFTKPSDNPVAIKAYETLGFKKVWLLSTRPYEIDLGCEAGLIHPYFSLTYGKCLKGAQYLDPPQFVVAHSFQY